MAKRVNLKACKDAIMEAAKDVLSEKDAKEFISAFEHRIETFKRENKLARVEDKLKELVEEMTVDLTKVAAIQKRNALATALAVTRMEKSAALYGDAAEGFLAFLDDSRRSIESGGRGVNAVIEGHKAKYLGELRGRLEQANLWNDFRSDRLTKEIFQEFYTPGSSGSKAARGIRDIMFAIKQDTVKKENLFGSFKHFLPEHVKRQEYSVDKINKRFGPERFKKLVNFNKFLSPEEYEQTFQNFAEFMMPLIDAEETFKDADPMKFLRGAFDGIMSGNHGPLERASGAEINSKFFKAGSMARQISTQRLIHFKDGDAAYAAHETLSGTPLSGGFVSELEHAATNIGLMQMMGPNPKAALEEAIKRTDHKLSRAGKNKEQQKLHKSRHKLMTALSFLDRSASIPTNPSMHTATASVISLLTQAKLGKIMLFALPDKVLVQSVLTQNGVKGLHALGSALRLTPPSSPGERTRLMMMGAELKSLIGSVNSRFSTGAEGYVPSLLHKSQQIFFKMSGIEWLDNMGTRAIVGTLPRHLGTMANKNYDNIVPQLREVFFRYGIDSDTWDAWRSTVYHTADNGDIKEGRGTGENAWVTPDRFENIPDSAIDRILDKRKKPISANNRARLRVELEEKFRTWLTAQRDEGVLMPGSKEHRLATFGTQAGTPAGSLMRLVMMFKTFPITVYTKIARREMHSHGARTFSDWVQAEKNSNFHTTQLIAMLTIAGYLSLTIEDLLNGKKPRSPMNKDDEFDTEKGLAILKESFLRGGAGGLQADLMLREYDEGYKNIVKALGGPVVNETIRGTSLASQAVRGEASPRKAVDFFRGNLPYANLFYVKPAIDHLVMFNLNEMLDPGYLRKLERQAEEDHQEYWLKPSEVHK